MIHIPNAITLLNLLFGCLAIVSAFSGNPAGAAQLIIICAILDFLDGTAARILKAGSEIGKQLDSLADLISFGLAPAAIMFHYMRSSPDMIGSQNSLLSYLPYFAFLITICSALRLARFNIDTRQIHAFVGLPTPANALFFASIPLAITYSANQGIVYDALVSLTSNKLLMAATILFFSWLLISPVKMFSLKFKSLAVKDNLTRYVFLTLSAIFLLLMGWDSTPLVILLYIIMSVAEGLIRKLTFRLFD